MNYIIVTRKLKIILSTNGIIILKFCIDGSFAVYPKMRGHNGGGISMGRVFSIFSSTKKKLNMRSSDVTEILANGACMTALLLTRYWLDSQGYYILEKIVYQDNKSAIILEKNSKLTKHINIR